MLILDPEIRTDDEIHLDSQMARLKTRGVCYGRGAHNVLMDYELEILDGKIRVL